MSKFFYAQDPPKPYWECRHGTRSPSRFIHEFRRDLAVDVISFRPETIAAHEGDWLACHPEWVAE